MKDGIYIVQINFNSEVEFDEGKEDVSIEIENGEIKSSTHPLGKYDRIAVKCLIEEGKYKQP